MKTAIAIAASHRGIRCVRDNRHIFVYIEICATQLPRSTNFLSNVRLPTDQVLNRREIHGCQEVLEEIREESPRQEVVVEEGRIEEGLKEGRPEEIVFEEGRQQEGVVEEGFLFEESLLKESFLEEGLC